MSKICILVAVDVEGALAANPPSPQGSVYLIDTNGFYGSYREGGNELATSVAPGQSIVWSVVPVDPGTQVTINGFWGPAVSGGQVTPEAYPDGTWNSLFQSMDPDGTVYQYSINLQFESGQVLSFDPYLVTKRQ